MLNKVTLVGYVATEPEIRNFPNGKHVVNFVLCTSERWKNFVGAPRCKYEMHRIAIFNDKLLEIIKGQVKRGVLLMVEGQLEARKYHDSNDVERTVVDIVLRPFRGILTVLEGFTEPEFLKVLNEEGEKVEDTKKDFASYPFMNQATNTPSTQFA